MGPLLGSTCDASATPRLAVPSVPSLSSWFHSFEALGTKGRLQQSLSQGTQLSPKEKLCSQSTARRQATLPAPLCASQELKQVPACVWELDTPAWGVVPLGLWWKLRPLCRGFCLARASSSANPPTVTT